MISTKQVIGITEEIDSVYQSKLANWQLKAIGELREMRADYE